jgi:hypothetical protein
MNRQVVINRVFCQYNPILFPIPIPPNQLAEKRHSGLLEVVQIDGVVDMPHGVYVRKSNLLPVKVNHACYFWCKENKRKVAILKGSIYNISIVLWAISSVVGLVLFVGQPAEVHFLATFFSGLAPLLYLLLRQRRPSTHAGIEVTLTGTFVFAMTLIVVGQLFLNSKPETWLAFLVLPGLFSWVALGLLVFKTPGVAEKDLKECLNACPPGVELVVFLSSGTDATDRAIMEEVSDLSEAWRTKTILFVSADTLEDVRREASGFNTIESNQKAEVPVIGFPFASFSRFGVVPGLVVRNTDGSIRFVRFWDDLRKRQEKGFVRRLTEA